MQRMSDFAENFFRLAALSSNRRADDGAFPRGIALRNLCAKKKPGKMPGFLFDIGSD
jgi:hypothetical protein